MTSSRPSPRPLFVPPGIPSVRTGPTTREEFERLLEEEGGHSEIHATAKVQVRRRLVGILTDILRLASRALRRQRLFESR